MAEETVNIGDQRASLRFYFWRFLDWKERNSVLISVGILPASCKTALPQTTEQTLLSLADGQGKSDAIWDAIMEYVPVQKRIPNPFK